MLSAGSSFTLVTMATPLPRSWYLDPRHFETEMAAVFGRAWLPAAHTSALGQPGDYVATRIGGHEIILVCGQDKKVRAFYNVCQHRAHRLLEGSGRLKTTIICPYHAWTYGLDGALRHARYSENATDFDESCFGLSPVTTREFAGFILVCFDDAISEPSGGLRDIETHLLGDHPSLPAMREVRRREAVLEANWKTIVENYLECYHCNVAHPSFGNFDITTWKHLLGDGWSRQGRVELDHDDLDHDDLDIGHGDIVGLSAWWQWPNIFWARAPDRDSFVAVFHEPLGANRTRQTRIVFNLSGQEDDELRTFNELFDEVFQEDVSLVEGVQRGLVSPGYRGGRLIEQPEARAGWSEHAVHHFQDLVRQAVSSRGS